MSKITYQDAWQFLDNLQFFKIKLGLDSMTSFLSGVGDPQDNLRFIHVAGTNGKGSVSVTLLKILTEAGYNVGLYTSPHLSSVRERFRINDDFISEAEFAAQAGCIMAALAGKQITYFEFTTALALLWFAARKVDLVILEVGLGGRLDATNVITPLVSVITNVSMDHEAYLGNTLAAVASEKAGVIKPGVPVVAGVDSDVSLEVVEDTCRIIDAPFYLLGRDFSVTKKEDFCWDYKGVGGRLYPGLTCSLPGEHQQSNSALALVVLELLEKYGFKHDEGAIRRGLAGVKWPGRLEYFCLTYPACMQIDPPDDTGVDGGDYRQYLLDGAHNPAGVAALAKYLGQRFLDQKIIMVWASMADKDVQTSLLAIAPLCGRLIFTRPESERSAREDDLLDILPDDLRLKALLSDSVADALAKAANLAAKDDLICVAGSLYLVGAARSQLLGEVVV